MKKKGIIISISVLAIAFFAAVTVMGSNELGFGGNNRPKTNTSRPDTLRERNNTFDWSKVENPSSTKSFKTAKVNEDVQEIATELESYRYPALIVQKDISVKWTIVADAESLNSCNNEIIIPDFAISQPLNIGENVIEFTPTETGVIQYSCWMGMVNSTVAVVDDINNYDEAEIRKQIAELPRLGGCCGGGF